MFVINKNGFVWIVGLLCVFKHFILSQVGDSINEISNSINSLKEWFNFLVVNSVVNSKTCAGNKNKSTDQEKTTQTITKFAQPGQWRLEDGWICYGVVIYAQLNQTDFQNLSEVKWELVKIYYFRVNYGQVIPTNQFSISWTVWIGCCRIRTRRATGSNWCWQPNLNSDIRYKAVSVWYTAAKRRVRCCKMLAGRVQWVLRKRIYQEMCNLCFHNDFANEFWADMQRLWPTTVPSNKFACLVGEFYKIDFQPCRIMEKRGWSAMRIVFYVLMRLKPQVTFWIWHSIGFIGKD